MAKILHSRHPDLFATEETARTQIRTVTGASGDHHRDYVKTVTDAYLGIAEPEVNDYSKVILESKKLTILSDIHLPYYDKTALDVAVRSLDHFKPDTLLLNGDIVDCYHVSSFIRDPRYRRLKYEVGMLRDFLTSLRKKHPKTRMIYKLGNHEERWERYIFANAPELVGVESFEFDGAVGITVKGFELVDNKRIIKAGKLNIVHGHEYGRGPISPVNPARTFFLKSKDNVIGGHYHQISEHSEPNLSGQIYSAWSTGCLSDLHPQYRPINTWSHGFAQVEFERGGEFQVSNLKIINGKVR